MLDVWTCHTWAVTDEYRASVNNKWQRETKAAIENLSQCQYLHKKSHINCPKFEAGSPWIERSQSNHAHFHYVNL